MNDLCSAIRSNDITAVNSLLADGSVDVNARIAELHNGTMLLLAADLGHVEIVTRLLDAGAQIDAVDDNGDTACHAAARNNCDAVVELLVARNADLSLQNQGNQTPITYAIFNKNEALVMLFIDTKMAAGTPLDDKTLSLAATVSAAVARLLVIKHRIDLSAIRDTVGRTLLHQALWFARDAVMIDALVGVAGVDVDARDKSGCAAAHAACLTRNAGAIARFIAAGANVNVADNNGFTPLHFSPLDPSCNIGALLLAAGANVHAKDKRGRTVCHIACEQSHGSLPALVAYGANLDEPDNDGVTPRELLKSAPPTSEDVEAARQHVLTVQLSLVRERASDVCIVLQSLDLDALCMCEILLHSCGPVAPFVPFHRWWQIATKVKHWQK